METRTPASTAVAATLPMVVVPQTLPASATSLMLRNTNALLLLTLLFSAGVAAVSAASRRPAPGIVPILAGTFGLLFVVYRLKNSVWALPAVFGLTGFMGYMLGPLLSEVMTLLGGGQVIAFSNSRAEQTSRLRAAISANQLPPQRFSAIQFGVPER